MKHLAALALFAAAAPAFAQERVANNDSVQEFPRWHSIAQVLNRKNNSTGARYLPSDLALAVDFKNVTHVAGIATNAALGASGSGSNVFYVNDDWIDRRSNGFSAPYQVSNVASNSPARDVEIVAMSDGAVYVVWSEDRNVNGSSLEEIYYRKRNADGSWNSITSAGAATLSSGTELFRNLRTLLTGSVFRMTFTRETSSATTLEYEYDPTSSWGSETVSDSSSTGYVPGGSNLAMKPDSSDIYVVFEDVKGDVTTSRYCVRYDSTSSWDTINDLYEGGFSPDIKFKSNYSAVYSVIVGPDGPSGDIGKVLYRVGSGDWVHIGNTNTATAAFDCARLALDNQNRPHILWRYSAGSPTYTGLGYALRMEGTGNWTRQEGIQEVSRANLGPSAGSADWSLGAIDLAIDGHGNPVWIDATSGLLSRSYEPNLGAQDPFVEVAAGPAATANGATGNLHLQIPLFSTSGVGYAVNFSILHNSLEPSWGVMSGGWAHNYHVYLVDSATGYNNSQDVITLVGGDGRRVIFRYNSTYSVHLADSEYAVFSKLERLSSSSSTDWVYSRYRLTTKFGEQAEFRADGKIEKLTDLNGNTMNFWYAGDSGYTPTSTKPQGALVEIEDSLKNLVSSQAGRKTKLLYNSDRQLASVQDPSVSSANYTISYNSTSKRLETLTFAGEADIDWTFTYHSADDADNKYRAGFLNLVSTPRGTLGSFGASYRWYLDNRIAKAIDPEVSVVVYDTYDYDPEANSPAREFLYSDPVEPFDDPNEGAPTANDVPTFTYRDRRTRDWIVEYQQRRSIADNWTDPDEESEVLTHDGTYRNLTLHQDREGRKTRYTWHTSTTPAWVGDNLWKVELPESSSTYRDPTVFTYTTDGFNRVASVTDPLGEATEYDYDSYGNLETVDYPDVTLVTGSTQTASEAFTYTTRGRVETWTDAEGNEWTWNYEDDDATGLVTKIQEPGQSLANARKFEYDAMGNLWKVTAPPNNLSGGVTEFVRDGLHRVETVVDPLDYEIGYTYDADSNVTQVEDRRGNLTTFDYDDRGDLVSVETPAGETTFVYDREQQIRRTTNPRGYTSKAIYDLTGRVSQTTQPTDAGDRVVDYTYNAAGQVTITDFEAVSNTTTYCDCACPETSFVKASQEATTVQRKFDEMNRNYAWNNLSGSSSPTFDFGQHTDFDERGRVRVRTQLTEAYSGSGSPTGKPTRYLHDKNGRVTQIWNPNGTTSSNAHSVRFAYDSRGRLYQVKDAYGNVVEQREYYEDNSLRYVKGQEPLVGGLITVRTLEYTVRGELWKDTDALSKVWTRAYDENGNLTSLTDPLSKVISWTYNDSDLVATETRYSSTLNIVTAYTYDENLNLETITVYNPDTEANDAVYEYAYDEDDNPISLTYPNTAHVEEWTWGTAKELLTHTDGNGKVTTYTYTGRRRLSQISHGSPYSEYVDFTYRGVTTLPATVNKDGGEDIVEYGYDDLLRVNSVEWTVGSSAYKSISYEYDDAGNRTLMTDPEGIDYEYTYDDNERLYQVKRDGTTQATYTYDEGGRIEEILYSNGSKRLYEYSDRSEVTKITLKNSSNATLASFEYEYNDRGEIIELVRGHLSETVTFDYDDDGRLIEESSSGGSGAGITVPSRSLAWEYDKAGNRTEQTADSVTTTYVYDEESRLLSHTTSSVTTDYTYDDNGSVLTRTLGDIEETFSYDYLDRAASYVKTDTSGPTTLEEWAYAHMPTGQRLYSQDLDADETSWYMHDGADVVTDYLQEGTGKLDLTVSYINALGLDDRIGRVTASGGATHFYVGDLLGTTAHLLTSSQTLVNSEVRDAWGNSVASSLSVADRYDFAGRESDSESGLTYMRHRLYDPRTGRFAQKDPIVGNRPSQHYLYGFNQPTGFTDPRGLEAFSWRNVRDHLSVAANWLYDRYAGRFQDYVDAFDKMECLFKLMEMLAKAEGNDWEAALWGMGHGVLSAVRGPVLTYAAFQHSLAKTFASNATFGLIDRPRLGEYGEFSGAADWGRWLGDKYSTAIDTVGLAASLATLWVGSGLSGGGGLLVPVTGPFGGAIAGVGALGMALGAAGTAYFGGNLVYMMSDPGKWDSANDWSGPTQGTGAGKPDIYLEKDLTGSGKHGLKWQEGPATARGLNKPQGRFTSQVDLDFVLEKAKTLGKGGEGVFDLPQGSTSVVYLPSGRIVQARKVFVQVKQSGRVHAYPMP